MLSMLHNLRKSKKDDSVVLTGVEVTVTLRGQYRNIMFSVVQRDDTRGPTRFEWAAGNEGKGRATSYNQAIDQIKQAVDNALQRQET